MITESKTMQELHKIRSDLYEETKELSLSKRVEYLKKQAGKAKKEYNVAIKQ